MAAAWLSSRHWYYYLFSLEAYCIEYGYSISSSIISLISCVPGFDALVSTSLPNLSVNKVLRVKIQINFFVSFTSPQKLNFVWQALLTSYNKPRKHDTLLKHYYYSLFS